VGWLSLVLQQIDRDFRVAVALLIWCLVLAFPTYLNVRELVAEITARVRCPLLWWWELPRVAFHGCITVCFMALVLLPVVTFVTP